MDGVEITQVGYEVNRNRQALNHERQARLDSGWGDPQRAMPSTHNLGAPPPLPPPTTEPPRTGGGTAGPAHAPGRTQEQRQQLVWGPQQQAPPQQQQYYEQFRPQQHGDQAQPAVNTAQNWGGGNYPQGRWSGLPQHAGYYQQPMTRKEEIAHAEGVNRAESGRVWN